MGMYRAVSDQDYDDEQLLNREHRAKQPVYCTEPGCNWTVWGESAKALQPRCIRHELKAQTERAS